MPALRKYNLFKIIIFIVVFLLILTAFSAVSDPVRWYDEKRVQDRNARLTELMEQDPYTIDVFNMGDSLSLSALTPMEMWRQRGYTSFNIGSDGIRMREIYYAIREATQEQDVKYLLFETLPLFRYKEDQDRQMLLSQPLYYMFDYLKYHNVWKTYTEGAGIKTYFKGYLINREVQEYKGDLNYLDQNLKGANVEIPDFNRAWFKEIKKYCDEKNIKIILYSSPSPKNYNRARINSLTAFAQEEGVEYFEMNQLCDEIGLNWKTDSNDQGDHMNLDGVIKMTTYFGDYLSGQGDLADHRGDPAYSRWDEDLAAYDQLVDEMEGMSYFLINEQMKKERREEKEKDKE